MNRSVIASTRRYVREQCMNCDKSTGFCLARDMPCVQVSIFENLQDGEPLRFCRHFREVLLSRNPVLEAQIWSGKPDGMAHCKTCGRPIAKTGNRQLYCTDCATQARRIAKAKNMRKSRAN